MIRWCLLLALGGLLFGWPKPATAAVDQSKRAALFAYDASQPLAVQVRRTRRHGTITEQDITFASPKGGRVTALMVPEGAGPFAGIILLHGATGSRHSLRRGARLLCAAGAVCLLPMPLTVATAPKPASAWWTSATPRRCALASSAPS